MSPCPWLANAGQGPSWLLKQREFSKHVFYSIPENLLGNPRSSPPCPPQELRCSRELKHTPHTHFRDPVGSGMALTGVRVRGHQ